MEALWSLPDSGGKTSRQVPWRKKENKTGHVFRPVTRGGVSAK